MSAASLGLSGRQAGDVRAVAGPGLVLGIVAIYLSLVGIVPVFSGRPLIAGVISLGQAAILATPIVSGFLAARRARTSRRTVAFAAAAGALTGLLLSLLLLLGPALNLRTFSQHATPTLWNLLTLGNFPDPLWTALPTFVGAVLGAGAGLVALLPSPVRRSLLLGVMSLVLLGLFAGVLRTPMLASPFAWLGRQLFATEGLTLYGAALALAGALGVGIGGAIAERLRFRTGGVTGGAIGGIVGAFLGGQLLATFAAPPLPAADALAAGGLVGGATGIVAGGLVGGLAHRESHRRRADERFRALPPAQQRLLMWPLFLAGLLIVLAVPQALGLFVAQVVALVALYIMMGLGLNITLGMAGLLDLGFVAFFAIGAYTVGLLTSLGPFGIAQLPFWAAVPFAVLFAFLFGAFLGLPVLGIRGDYLAIATLGFGEIVAILAGSDLLKPWIGGPQGVTLIPPPVAIPPDPGHPLAVQKQVYYIALAAAAVIAFLSYRLRDSRLGRAWIAIREDEDVAEALGINLVQTKLLAYSLGAAFAGLGGAVFAGLVGAVFASNIELFVSINVAAIVIIGGMGSIPGVVLGAVFLIGVPQLFREFSEYRFLFYGAALILMMRFRPEGLLPSTVAARELHVEEENVEAAAVAGSAVTQRAAEDA